MPLPPPDILNLRSEPSEVDVIGPINLEEHVNLAVKDFKENVQHLNYEQCVEILRGYQDTFCLTNNRIAKLMVDFIILKQNIEYLHRDVLQLKVPVCTDCNSRQWQELYKTMG